MSEDADIFDLQPYIIEHHPLLWEVTKYLSAPYKIWNQAWIDSGRPDISEPAPYSS